MNPWEWMKKGWEKLEEGIGGVLNNIFGGSLVEDFATGVKSYLEGVDLSSAGDKMFGSFRDAAARQLDAVVAQTKGAVSQIESVTGIFAHPDYGAGVIEPGMSAYQRGYAMGLPPEELQYLQGGGTIKRTGLAVVHKCETVIPAGGGLGMSLTINFNEPVFMEREESINKLANKIYGIIKQNQRLNFGGAIG